MSTDMLVVRDSLLDKLRGLAVVLMVLDHVALVLLVSFDLDGSSGTVAYWVRLTVTRAALPLFMVVAGMLISRRDAAGIGRSNGLRIHVAAAWSLLVIVAFGLPIATPDILALFVGVWWLIPVIARHPLPVLALGVVQLTAWPIAWGSYQPGAVLALVAAGVLYADSGLGAENWTTSYRLPAWCAQIGRFPLWWYLGHLVALGLIVGVFT